VLIGIPLEWEEFISRVSVSDWLAKFYQPGLTPGEQRMALAITWEEDYEPLVARPFRQLIERAENLGVEVPTKSTLGDLGYASTRKGVIVIFSHWKGPEILPGDLQDNLDRETLQKQIAQSQEPIARRIETELDKLDRVSKRGVGPRWIRRWWERDARPSRNIREILFATVEESLPEAIDGIDEVIESKSVSQARGRDALDVLLTSFIRPGNRLELFDGMHSKQEVELIIAKEFSGVLDLTMCTSTYLGDYLSARRKQSLRTVQFPNVQKFDSAVNCVTLALEIAVREDIAYLEARRSANQIFTAEVLDICREKNLET